MIFPTYAIWYATFLFYNKMKSGVGYEKVLTAGGHAGDI